MPHATNICSNNNNHTNTHTHNAQTNNNNDDDGDNHDINNTINTNSTTSTTTNTTTTTHTTTTTNTIANHTRNAATTTTIAWRRVLPAVCAALLWVALLVAVVVLLVSVVVVWVVVVVVLAWVVLVVGFGPEIGRARPCVCFGCECFLMGWVAPGACGGGRRLERRLLWIQQRWARCPSMSLVIFDDPAARLIHGDLSVADPPSSTFSTVSFGACCARGVFGF